MSYAAKKAIGGRGMPRASSAEAVKRKEAVRVTSTVQSARAVARDAAMVRVTSTVPSARVVTRDAATSTGVSFAVSPDTRREVTAAMEFFRGYDEHAEDAAHLLIGVLNAAQMPVDGGVLIGVLSGKQSQKMVVYLIDRAVRRVMLTGFTFDLTLIAEALVRAAVRGLDVTAILDANHALKGSTTWMVDRLSTMKVGRVKVRLSHGLTGESGIQHSKTVLCDEYVVIGSCNWTTSSRSNHEIDVLLALNEVGLAAYDERVRFINERAVDFSLDMERQARDHKKKLSAAKETRLEKARVPRSESVPPGASDRYATAKRFSIARGRSVVRGTASRAAEGQGSQPSGSSTLPSAGAAQQLNEMG